MRRHPPALVLAALAALAPVLAGCGPFNAAVGTLAGLDAVVSVPVFGRSTADLAYSAVTGRDCSIVRLEQGRSYCRRAEAAFAQPYCTRSLGTVDCWADPRVLPGHPAPVGDTPPSTPAQAAHRAAPWPDL